MSAPLAFKPASREAIPLKLALMGASGSGKSYSALILAATLAEGGKVAAIDTENGSLSLYAGVTPFDVIDLEPPYQVKDYVGAIKAAEAAGYAVLIVDSFSHAWRYLLDKKEELDSRGGNKWTNWKPIKEEHRTLVDALLQSKLHVICCMRSKTEYAQEGGKVNKLGMAAIAEPDIEYEFTVVWDIAASHKAKATKDRTELFADELATITAATAQRLLDWRASGKAVTPKAAPAATAPAKPAPSAEAAEARKVALAKFKALELTKEEVEEYKTLAKSLGVDWVAHVAASTAGDFAALLDSVRATVNPPLDMDAEVVA